MVLLFALSFKCDSRSLHLDRLEDELSWSLLAIDTFPISPAGWAACWSVRYWSSLIKSRQERIHYVITCVNDNKPDNSVKFVFSFPPLDTTLMLVHSMGKRPGWDSANLSFAVCYCDSQVKIVVCSLSICKKECELLSEFNLIVR